jgi:hypothetical protein
MLGQRLLLFLLFVGVFGNSPITYAQCDYDIPTQCRVAQCWISWDAPPDDDIAWYAIYCGDSSGFYQRKVLVDASKRVHLIDSLFVNRMYFLAMTSIDYAGNESDYSNEIIFWRNTYNMADLNGDTRVDYRDKRMFDKEYYKYNPKKSIWEKIKTIF